MKDLPPICDYEGSNYQTTFWDYGGRAYEDQTEAVALRRLLPTSGKLMLEIGAGAGRNTHRYRGYERIILSDYSFSQMQLAQKRLGRGERYMYVAADVYRLPFVDELFDGATMIRVLHHIVEPPLALNQIRRVMQTGGTFILEFASKYHLKSFMRFAVRGQEWNPYTLETIESTHLNFNFHPKTVRRWLQEANFGLQRQLTVSHFRMKILKRLVPTKLLVAMDSIAQLSGDWWQLTPSVFTKSMALGHVSERTHPEGAFFRCPACKHDLPMETEGALVCPGCEAAWPIVDGIYDFRGRE